MENISGVLTQTVFILALVGLPVAWLFNRRRRQSLSSHYAKLHFKAVDAADFKAMLNADRFAMLGRNWLNAGRASELHIGNFEGLDMAQFTLSRSDGSQSGRQQTVTFIKGETPLPGFVLRPESMTDKLLDKFKAVDIDFDSHPNFSASYQLVSSDEPATRAFFDDALLGYFEENPGFSVECVGRDVLIFREYKRVSGGADIDVQLRLAHNLYQRLLQLGDH